MKRILYIHQYFKTPEEGGAIRSYHISKGMVERRMQVEVLTSHNKPKYEQKTINGIQVHYLPVNYSNELSFSRRYLAFFKFVFAAVKLSQKLQKPDLCFVTSTPLTVGLIALWLKWTRQIPYIFEVRDLWPEAPIQLGLIRSTLIKHLSVRLEKVIYKNANRIIALSPGIEKGILNKYGKVRISMIPNMADIDFFNEKPSKINEKENFGIGYFGAFGMANNLEYILDAANECQKSNLNVTFLLIGEGARKKAIEQKAIQLKLNNIKILPHQNRFEIKILLEEVDACFTSFLNNPILETNSPNKFFDGLAAGKLCIVNSSGWLRDIIEQYKCGFYSDPDKPEKFPLLIEPFVQDKKLLTSFQKNAIRLGKTKFNKERLVCEICDLVLNQSTIN